MAKKGGRRTAEERIQALQTEIERIKKRQAEQKAKKDPALRHISSAVRAIDKASAATKDKPTRKALTEARATLTACLALHGAEVGGGAARPRHGRPDPETVLDYLRKHPGSRSEQICADLNTDALALRPVLHKLRDEKKVKVSGKARATTYAATGKK